MKGLDELSRNSWDLLVVGAGVVGLSIAYEASSRGWRVAVCDANTVGRGASWSGAGMLPASSGWTTDDPLENLRALSHSLHAIWAEELVKSTGIDTGYRRWGGIYLGSTRGEAATLRAQETWWNQHGIDFRVLKRTDLLELAPDLATWFDQGDRPAWFLPSECQLRNPRHLQALEAACRMRGVLIVENTPLTHWLCRDRIASAEFPGMKVRASRICVAAGAWSQSLLGQLGIASGILPVRGQMVLYRLDRQHWLPNINDGHRYLVPRSDGLVLAGSCEEEVGFVNETTQEMIDQLHGWAHGLLPALTRDRIEKTWAGLRPGSFDGLPYMGRLPGTDNAFVASGHFRHGLHLSPGTARVMVQLMRDEPVAVDLTPFEPTRGKTSLEQTRKP